MTTLAIEHFRQGLVLRRDRAEYEIVKQLDPGMAATLPQPVRP